MIWGRDKLGKIAPAKALKAPDLSQTENIWQLNLDRVESQTGLVKEKIEAPLSEAGSSTHWFDETHVLYSKLRPYLNKVVLPEGIGLATTELVPMLPDATRLDRKYLAYYLRSKGFVDWISAQVAGAKMPRVSMKVFWDHEIPLPYPDDPEKSLKEQKRIAAILDKADGIRRKRQQAIELADDFLRSVFLDMFGDPVTNPKGWEVKPLIELAESDKRAIVDGPFGASLKTDEYVDKGIRVIRINNIHERKFVNKKFKFITNEKYEELSRSSVNKNDLLIARVGHTIGKACVFNQDYKALLSTTGVCKVTCNSKKLHYKFLEALWASNSFQLYIKGFVRGAGQPYYNLTTIKAFEIISPSIEIQKKYVQIVEAVDKALNWLMMPEADGEQLFNSLSQKAFKGEL